MCHTVLLCANGGQALAGRPVSQQASAFFDGSRHVSKNVGRSVRSVVEHRCPYVLRLQNWAPYLAPGCIRCVLNVNCRNERSIRNVRTDLARSARRVENSLHRHRRKICDSTYHLIFCTASAALFCELLHFGPLMFLFASDCGA